MIERVSRAAAAALQEPGLRDKLLGEGQFALGTGPEEFARFLRQEAERWAPVLQRMNLQID